MTAPTPWARFVMPLQYAADATGTPLGGGKLYFYATGTSTPQDTFADATLPTPNPNPVVALQDGTWTWPPIFLDQKQYSMVLTDTGGTTIWQVDPVAPYIPATETLGSTVVAECTEDGNGNARPRASAVTPSGHRPVEVRGLRGRLRRVLRRRHAHALERLLFDLGDAAAGAELQPVEQAAPASAARLGALWPSPARPVAR